MYPYERKAKILHLLERHSSMSVNMLSQAMDVSKETVRRDLSLLEKEGLLSRTHGGAVLNLDTSDTTTPYRNISPHNEYPFAKRHTRNIPAKRSIAKKAASFIEDGDIIFIDNSSTTLFLMDYIPQNIELTIITNSIKVLLESSRLASPYFHVIALSGFYDYTNYSLHGSKTIKSAMEFYPDKSFFSCTGISIPNQLTDISLNEVDTKQAIMEKSKKNYLLVDHTKFGTDSAFYLSNFHPIHYIVTDPYSHKEEALDTMNFIKNQTQISVFESNL